MSRAEKIKRRLSAGATFVGLSIAVCLSTASRAQTEVAGGQEQKTAEQVYKNIQVLTGLPASELDGVMEFMSASLGVGCTFCHTNPWDSDVKPAKLTTRRMIQMTRALNKEHFSGNPVVNCYTCHRGQPQTVTIILPSDLATAEPADSKPTSPKASPSLPSIDQVIDRYIQEIGGQAAVDKMKTRVSRGTETTTNRMTPPASVPIELYQTAANKLLAIRSTPRGAVEEGFNGSTGWIKDDGGLQKMPDKRLAEIRRDAYFYRYLKIRQTYPQMRLLGTETVGDREAWVVGATSSDDTREKLYFDAKTGLLIRTYIAFRTAFATIPEVTDFDDYRKVNEARLPFTITWSRPPFSSTRKFTQIRLNAIVDDARFEPRAK